MYFEWLFLLIVGLFAGIIGGLLGIGGGVVLMPALRFIVGVSPAIAVGTTVFAVFTTTLGGGIKHYKLGNVKLKKILPLIIAGSFSSLLFSFLFLKIAKKEAWLDLGIGFLFLFVSLYMIYDALKHKTNENYVYSEVKNAKIKMLFLGIVSGILPGLFGIGAGAVLVPSFLYLLKMPIKMAIGSSLVCFCANAFVSSAMKLSQGYIDFYLLVPICLGCIIGSQLGALIGNKTKNKILKGLFALFFLWSSYRFIVLGLGK